MIKRLFLWGNDDKNKRAYGSKTDAYKAERDCINI